MVDRVTRMAKMCSAGQKRLKVLIQIWREKKSSFREKQMYANKQIKGGNKHLLWVNSTNRPAVPGLFWQHLQQNVGMMTDFRTIFHWKLGYDHYLSVKSTFQWQWQLKMVIHIGTSLWQSNDKLHSIYPCLATSLVTFISKERRKDESKQETTTRSNAPNH